MKTPIDWSTQSPPKNTWVWAIYKSDDAWQIFKTCKRGCCVYSFIGTMTLPKFWYLATIEEGLIEEDKWKNTPEIDMFDLY